MSFHVFYSRFPLDSISTFIFFVLGEIRCSLLRHREHNQDEGKHSGSSKEGKYDSVKKAAEDRTSQETLEEATTEESPATANMAKEKALYTSHRL